MSRISALDNCGGVFGGVNQAAVQSAQTTQRNEELIKIIDSHGVRVTTTDTQAAVNLQVAIQLAIALVLSLTIASGDKADQIAQELFQRISTKQEQNQKMVIENSRGVSISVTDTQAAVNVQVLAQILAAIVAKISVL